MSQKLIYHEHPSGCPCFTCGQSPATNFGTALDEHTEPTKLPGYHYTSRILFQTLYFLTRSNKEPYLKATPAMNYSSNTLTQSDLTKTKYLFNPFDFKLYHPPVLSDPVLSDIAQFNVEKYSNKSQPQLMKKLGLQAEKQPTQNFATILTSSIAPRVQPSVYKKGRGKQLTEHSNLSQPYSLSCFILSQGTGFTALLGLSTKQLPLQTLDSWLMAGCF